MDRASVTAEADMGSAIKQGTKTAATIRTQSFMRRYAGGEAFGVSLNPGSDKEPAALL